MKDSIRPKTEGTIDGTLLQEGDSDARLKLCSQIQEHGFAILSMKNHSCVQIVQRVLDEAETMNTFRFPPHDADIQYTPLRRKAFQALFDIAKECLCALLNGQKRTNEKLLALRSGLSRSQHESLFSSNKN